MAFEQADFEQLFGGLVEELNPPERTQLFHGALTRHEAQAGDVVVREGEERRRLCLVGTARLKVALLVDGRRVDVGEFGPGSVLGEVSFLLGGAATATIDVSAPGTLFFLTPEILDRISPGSPSLAGGFLRGINRTLIARILDATDRFDETQSRYAAHSRAPVPADAGNDSLFRPNAPAAGDGSAGKWKAAFLQVYRVLLGAKNSEKIYMDVSDFLRTQPRLAALPAVDRQKLAAVLHASAEDKDHVYFHEGNVGQTAYVILEGEVSVFRVRDGVEVEISRLGEGEIFGLIGLIAHDKRSATCRAVGHVKTAALRHEDFAALSKSDPAIGNALQRVLAEQLARDFVALDKRLREAIATRDWFMSPEWK